MGFLRARLSSVALVAATLAASAAPLFAAPADPACLAHHHECSQTAQLKGCCCLESGDRSHEATPANGKTQIAQPATDAWLVSEPAVAPPRVLRHARALTKAPRSSPPDLITLFGAFLI